MNVNIIEQKYNEGNGVKVEFYDNEFKIGEASTVEYNGKPNNFLHGFKVEKIYRGKGYGAKILKYMIEKYNVEILYVAKDNKVIDLYRRFGFAVIDNFGENMIIMQRNVKQNEHNDIRTSD